MGHDRRRNRRKMFDREFGFRGRETFAGKKKSWFQLEYLWAVLGAENFLSLPNWYSYTSSSRKNGKLNSPVHEIETAAPIFSLSSSGFFVWAVGYQIKPVLLESSFPLNDRSRLAKVFLWTDDQSASTRIIFISTRLACCIHAWFLTLICIICAGEKGARREKQFRIRTRKKIFIRDHLVSTNELRRVYFASLFSLFIKCFN